MESWDWEPVERGDAGPAVETAQKAGISKREIAADINHRYRTALTSVICYTEILIDQQFGTVNETQKEFLSFIYEGAQELLDMISEIYDSSGEQ